MEYAIGIIGILVVGLFYYKSKATRNAENAILAGTKGEDKQLKKRQDEVDFVISEMDAGIAEIKAEREKRRKEAKEKSDENLVDDWNNTNNS